MREQSDQQLECVRDDGYGLRLHFHWLGDRFGQRVELIAGEQAAVPLLQSMERGDIDPAWPTSPPLQQLHLEDRPDGPAAMLVGMAGRSHWSMSVETRPAVGALQFDVACRLHVRPRVALGSMYQYLCSGAAISFLASHVYIAASGQTIIVALDQTARDAGAHWVRQADQIRLDVPVPDVTLPATLRWRYTLTLE